MCSVNRYERTKSSFFLSSGLFSKVQCVNRSKRMQSSLLLIIRSGAVQNVEVNRFLKDHVVCMLCHLNVLTWNGVGYIP